MNKKKNYILWVAMFIASIAISLYLTWLLYKQKITGLVYVMNAITILDILIAVLDFRKRFIYPYINNHKEEYNLDEFVDRDLELKSVIQKINSGDRMIYISGELGIGKTQFLHKIIHSIYHTKKVFISSSIYPLYIELKQGENIKDTIKKSIEVNEDLNNLDLLKALHNSTKSKYIIILLDNANKQLYLEIEEFVNTLINLDSNLFFIITAESLEPMYKPIEMSRFTEKEVYDIGKNENLFIDENTCKTIIKNSNGLPVIIRLLVKQLKLTGELNNSNEIYTYINKICTKLSVEQKQVLATIAFYSLKKSTFSEYTLAKYNSLFTYNNLSEIADQGLIDYNHENGLIVIEEFFAHIIRSNLCDMKFQVCGFLYNMIEERNPKDKFKLVFLLLSNLNCVSEAELLESIELCIIQKEYNFLIYLFEILDNFRFLNKSYDTKIIRAKLLYCYTHSLLEIGEYKKAYNYIYCSNVWEQNICFRNIDSSLDFDFNYDLADMEHFFGNFESAITSYFELIEFGVTESQLLKCKWSIAHCYRHLGDSNSMNIATTCFKEIIEQKKDYYIRSYQALVLIKLFLNDKEFDYENAFEEMIEYLTINDNKRVREIYTSRQYAIYHRIVLKDYEKALEILFSALKDLEILGIRIKYDYYFEVAETLRHKLVQHYDLKTLSECLSYYNKALNFAERVGDISLKCVSQIGIVLCNIIDDHTNHSDIETIVNICDVCKDKKIAYIYNYAYKIKEYILNSFYESYDYSGYKRREIIDVNLLIM